MKAQRLQRLQIADIRMTKYRTVNLYSSFSNNHHPRVSS